MKEIWKYTLRLQDKDELQVPAGSVILSVGNPKENLWVWILVNPNETEKETKKFRIYGTGHPVDESILGRFLGTVSFMDGNLIFHVFEETL